MNRKDKMAILNGVVAQLEATYQDEVGINAAGGESLPRRSEVINLTEKMLELIFPGFDRAGYYPNTKALLSEIHLELTDQIARAMRREGGEDCECCDEGCGSRCDMAAVELLKALPKIREILKQDVAAAYSGDPAAMNYDEIILSYPGVKAVAIQRLAHVLYVVGIPLIPRIMTEYAHTLTGIDIHPGAKLGAGIFIDHGTGVVIGETAVLGDNVRIYQGVTLGAGNFPKDSSGSLIKGLKRHPTIGNRVTIYSNASVLGNITIGDDSVIGGNVWLTESLPPKTKITAPEPANRLRFASEKNNG